MSMPTDDSLEEHYRRVLEVEFGRHAHAVSAYLEKRHKGKLPEGESPREIIRRELLLVFGQGVNEYVRQAVWDSLEEERKRRGLTQAELAEKQA